MAKSLNPVFAAGKYENIAPAIESGTLSYPAYIFCTDKNTMAFVDKNQSIQTIQGYNQDAVILVDELPETGVANIIYICDNTGYLYIDSSFVQIFSSLDSLSYDSLKDIPIIHKKGEVGDSVILCDLDDGSYSVTGQYRITDNGTVYLTSKQVPFLVETDDENRYITKFGTGEIVLYTISLESGSMTIDKYSTQSWVEEQGYAKETYVTEAVSHLYETIIAELAITKVSQLENDVGYLTSDDFYRITRADIIDLFA